MKKRLGSDRPAPVWRAGRAGAALTLVALAVSGCMSLKENKVVQTTPGKVTIRTVVCASNFAANKECGPANLFAVDNNRTDATAAKKGSSSSASASRSALTGRPTSRPRPRQSPSRGATPTPASCGDSLRPPPTSSGSATSAVGDYDPKGTRLLAMEPEFTLPASAAGSPFRWRAVVGFREGGDAAAPVSCPQPDPKVANPCVESPADTRIRTDEVSAVSDFNVVGGATATAFPGTIAVVPFKVLYADGAHLGKQTFSLSARTALPGRTPGSPLSCPPAGTAPPRSRRRCLCRRTPRRGGTRSPSPARSAPPRPPAPPRARSSSNPCHSSPTSRRPCPRPGTSTPPFKVTGGRKVTQLTVTKVPAKGVVTAKCRGRG